MTDRVAGGAGDSGWLAWAGAGLTVLRQGVRGMTGWWRLALAMAAGALSIFAMAPHFQVAVLLVSMPVLIWLLDGCGSARGVSPRARFWQAFWTGWAFGFGYFFLGLLWIGHAFMVNAEVFAWMRPIAVTVLPAGLSLFWGLACGLFALVWRAGAGRVLVLAALLTVAELGRGYLFTGFPWNAPGYAWIGHLEVAQAAAWIGVYGLTFFTLALASVPALLAEARRTRVWDWVLPGVLVVALAGLWGAGAARLSAFADEAPVADVKLRIVQPLTRLTDRRDPEKRTAIWPRLLALTADAREQGVTHVVWPESAPIFFLAREEGRRRQVAELLGPDMVLLTGALRAEEQPQGGYGIYNGFLVLNGDGRVLSTYDKHHLVPFGEYLPLKPVLSRLGFRQVVDTIPGFEIGPGPRTLSIPGAPSAGIAICYEIIFSGAVVDSDDRPGFLINVSDDGWFGKSSGPHQHLAIARMRAIEENMPLVRSTNSGISALVDRFGRVEASLGIEVMGALDVDLPAAGPLPLYARLGVWPVLLLCVGLVAAAWMCRPQQ